MRLWQHCLQRWEFSNEIKFLESGCDKIVYRRLWNEISVPWKESFFIIGKWNYATLITVLVCISNHHHQVIGSAWYTRIYFLIQLNSPTHTLAHSQAVSLIHSCWHRKTLYVHTRNSNPPINRITTIVGPTISCVSQTGNQTYHQPKSEELLPTADQNILL